MKLYKIALSIFLVTASVLSAASFKVNDIIYHSDLIDTININYPYSIGFQGSESVENSTMGDIYVLAASYLDITNACSASEHGVVVYIDAPDVYITDDCNIEIDDGSQLVGAGVITAREISSFLGASGEFSQSWFYNNLFGWIYTDFISDWLYSPTNGWLYLAEEYESSATEFSVWLWSWESQSFLYADSELIPYVFDTNDNTWVEISID